jgi:N-acetyl-gamma-glutamyl-phosphate reductase|tara:strand:- start:104 stop:1075 length:972 start_codon:yes stop_codon:yes gene_type:complete
MHKLKIGIAGGAGYTAGELIRILCNHPNIDQIIAESESQKGKKISSIHTDLVGDIESDFQEKLDVRELDVVFLCKGHGQSKIYLEAQAELYSIKIIDLSQDFRISGSHEFVYGLPEMSRERIRKANYIANPGCFATAIQLGLLPAVAASAIHGAIHVSGLTGSTGAGQAKTATSHYSWRNDNASVYKAFEHQHLQEIGQSCVQLNPSFSSRIYFIPYRGAFTRGIITSTYFNSDENEATLKSIYKDYYDGHPFSHVIDQNPDLKMVTNTNKALIHVSKTEDQVLVITVIDNLLKGASGQAIQNMNLIFDLDEAAGLALKSNVY